MSLILTNIENRVGTILLNRPEKRNALSAQLISELTTAFETFNNDDAVKIILLKSADLPFCAGADLAYLTELRNFTFEENVADSTRLKNLFELIYTSPKITISQVEGPALAGGCGLATVTDFCFASIDATFGYTEAKIGFLPALVMVYLKEKVGMSIISDWLLTGRVFSADEAFNKGLIFQLSSADAIESDVKQFVSKLLTGVSSQSVAGIKYMLRNMPNGRDEALKFAAEMNAIARSSEDCKRGIDAFLNKEKLTW